MEYVSMSTSVHWKSTEITGEEEEGEEDESSVLRQKESAAIDDFFAGVVPNGRHLRKLQNFRQGSGTFQSFADT